MWRLQYLQNFKLLYIILKCDRLLLLNLLTGCNPGYYAKGDVCTGCPAGTYKSTAGNSEDLCTNCTADQFLTSNISSTVASDCGTCYFLLQFQGNYSIHKRVWVVLFERRPKFILLFQHHQVAFTFRELQKYICMVMKGYYFCDSIVASRNRTLKHSGNYTGSHVLFPGR